LSACTSAHRLSTHIHQVVDAEHLWISEKSLLGRLAHLHVNRLLGIDRNRETQVSAFWRHTLDALQRRPDHLFPLPLGMWSTSTA
jgi:hypothetical protein